MVGLDVENGGGTGVDGGGQLGRGALVGITGLHHLAATQVDHGADRRAEVHVVTLGQHYLARHPVGMGMQLLQPVGIAAYYDGGHRLGYAGTGAGDHHGVFHAEQAGQVGACLVDQILHLEVVAQAEVDRVDHLLLRGGDAEDGHAPGGVESRV